jgi:hypothetical protein
MKITPYDEFASFSGRLGFLLPLTKLAFPYQSLPLRSLLGAESVRRFFRWPGELPGTINVASIGSKACQLFQQATAVRLIYTKPLEGAVSPFCAFMATLAPLAQVPN